MIEAKRGGRGRWALGLLAAAATAACSDPPEAVVDGGGTVCGDRLVTPGEQCDDGNTVGGDGCSADCQTEAAPAPCGDRLVDPAGGETCDDGNTVSGDGCSADCRSNERCGNGVRDTDVGEVCDDGNTADGDLCGADCRTSVHCGDGVAETWLGEECDAGGASTATCDVDGTRAACGDGYVNAAAGEICDSDPACNWFCRPASCGDGAPAVGEQCDPGTSGVPNAWCDLDCTLPACGDGTLNPEASEDCDDGNTVDGDGCQGNCRLP